MNHLKLATLIAECASHFDAASSKLPLEMQRESELHVELLHDAAALLAGEDVSKVYCPEDLIRYAPLVQYQKTASLGGETVGLCHNRDIAGNVTAMITVGTGAFNLALFSSAQQLREFILALRELVDECDASAAQHIDLLPIHLAAGLGTVQEAA